MPTITLPLSPALRARAERFFDSDLSTVCVHIRRPSGCGLARSGRVRRRGAWACAIGDHVFLEACVLALPWPLVLEVVGHELAHVLQQRAGASRGLTRAQWPLESRRRCEREAADIGRRFAKAGARGHGRRLEPSPLGPQCAVSVAGRGLRQMDDVSPKAQTLLALVDGAEPWLSWAVQAPTAFAFGDEAALAVGVQQGLHGSPMLLLQRLATLVHPRRLWALSEELLNQVLAYENDDGENAASKSSLTQVLNAQGILTQADLEPGAAFLHEVGLAANPMFQGLTLAERIMLLDVAKHPPTMRALNHRAQHEAAAFAAESAQTPRDFCDLYGFYFAAAPDAEDWRAIGAAARRMRDLLATSVHPFLSCPAVSYAPSPVELYALVNRWVEEGVRVGFASVASAMRQIVATGLVPATVSPQEVGASVESAVDVVQQFLKTTEPSKQELTQDGLVHRYYLEGKSASARLDLSQEGWVTLGSYRPAALARRGNLPRPSSGSTGPATKPRRT